MKEIGSRFNVVNNAQTRNSKNISQEKNQSYTDIPEDDMSEYTQRSNRESLQNKAKFNRNNPNPKRFSNNEANEYNYGENQNRNNPRRSNPFNQGDEYGNYNNQYDPRNQMGRRTSRAIQGYDQFSDDDLNLDEDIEETCAIHSKELDMICLESSCQTPVCSKCILVGDHKNHKYVEKEKFFNNLEQDKNKMLGFKNRIESAEQHLKMNNDRIVIFQQIKSQRTQIEEEIQIHCQKLTKEINNKKDEALREVKIHFEQLGEKLQNYVSETVHVVKYNKLWKKKLEDALRLVNQSESDIESGFLFKEESQVLKIQKNGESIIANISELQGLINNKIGESLGSFTLKCDKLKNNFLVISKQEVSFKQDLRERMQIFIGETAKKPKESNTMKFDDNFAQTVEQYNKGYSRDTDLLADDFDPMASNLMLGLNESDPYKRGNLQPKSGNSFNMKNPNQAQNPTHNINKFNSRGREGLFNKEDEEKYYLQTNPNERKQTKGRKKRSRSKSMNNEMKQKHESRKNPGILIMILLTIIYMYV